MTTFELWMLRAKARDLQADVYEIESQIEPNAEHYRLLVADYRQMARDCRKTALELATGETA